MHNACIIKPQATSHAIMFHHFHDNHIHITGQGSISSQDFSDMLDFYGHTHNIISADEFLLKSQNDSLDAHDVCLTFDDGLLCQYDIALPIMTERRLRAFWFIYSSPMCGILEKLEIYRHFRFSMFSDVEEFYNAFFNMAFSLDYTLKSRLSTFNPDEYLKEFPFYTPDDKRFRYLRDRLLGETRYNEIMDRMIAAYGYNVRENASLLWITPSQIKSLHEMGHIIGLHSHTHPTVMSSKSLDEQLREYSTNQKCLEEITGHKVISASYPCNSYNHDTLKCMHSLGIEIAFRANMSPERLGDLKLEYPREDHANIIREMRSV